MKERKTQNFDTKNNVFERAKSCKRCYGDRPIFVPFPDPKNGIENVKIMFINERPGRIGTGASRIVSFDNDDPSAKHFKSCFELLNILRKEIFATNACLCHPEFEGYTDKAPSIREIKNCLFWLEQQIKAVNPKLLVPLGNSALESLKRHYNESKQLEVYELKNNIGTIIKDTPICIYPVYHTSQRARLTRSAEQQKKDWLKIKEIIRVL